MQSILQHSFFTLMDMFWLQATWNTLDLQKLKSIFHSVYKIPKKKLLGNNIHQIHMWADKNFVGIVKIFEYSGWNSGTAVGLILCCFALTSLVWVTACDS